MALTPPVVTI
jgi:hypothetical protein